MKILVAVAVLSTLFAWSGCANSGLTQQEVDSIMAKAAVATASVDTVAFETNSETIIEIIGGADAGTATLSTESTGVADHAANEARLSASLTLEGQNDSITKIAMETEDSYGNLYYR